MKAVIFDIDGTLANVEHRLHHLDDNTISRDEQWKRFFADQIHDTPNQDVVWLFNRLLNVDRDYAVLVVSARPNDHRDVTINFLWTCLEKRVPFPDQVYMRSSGDHRADAIVKAELLQKIIDDGYEPFLVVDDRPEVVKMWRDFGITCLQCADEPVRSKYAGQTLLTMMVGPAGAGKSTHIESCFPDNIVVSTDRIREENGWGHSPDDLKRTWQYTHALVKARLECGLRTVLDATNIRRKDRMSVLKLVPEGQLVEYVLIDREFDEKLRTRGWRSEELVRKHHNTFQSNIKEILRGDDQPNVIVKDERKHKV